MVLGGDHVSSVSWRTIKHGLINLLYIGKISGL
ncbi:MAG: hypothetical protein ACI9ON_004204, partial [Limisphaerales bacterium]